jgi:hypothetical protein
LSSLWDISGEQDAIFSPAKKAGSGFPYRAKKEAWTTASADAPEASSAESAASSSGEPEDPADSVPFDPLPPQPPARRETEMTNRKKLLFMLDRS